MLTAVGVEHQRAERNLENGVEGAAAGELAVDPEIGRRQALDVAVGDEAQDEGDKSRGNRQFPAKATIIRHQPATPGVQRNRRESERKAPRVLEAVITEIVTLVDDVDQEKESVEIEQPRGDLQCLRLHPIEPALRVEGSASGCHALSLSPVAVVPRAFRFSVMTSGAPDATGWRHLIDRIDAEGYDLVHMPQHRGAKGFAPLVALGFVAARSSRLRVGTLVLDNESVHPAIVARDAATLDLLSEGRLELGIGAGWLAADHASIGQEFATAGTRIERLEEAIDVLRACWSGDTASFRGRHFTIDGAPNDPLPAQPGGPPVLVGGGGKRVLQLAARTADIVSLVPNMSAGRVGRESAANATGAATGEKLAWVREAAGSRLPDIELHTNLTNVFVTDDRMPMMEKVARGYGLDNPIDALDIPHVVIGTVAQCVEQLIERRSATGISHYTVFEANIDAFAPILAELVGR